MKEYIVQYTSPNVVAGDTPLTLTSYGFMIPSLYPPITARPILFTKEQADAIVEAITDVLLEETSLCISDVQELFLQAVQSD
jgi:hypothetical protein